MNKRLNEKVAIVTGGARGIAKGIVYSLGSEGAKVVYVDQNQEQGKQTDWIAKKEATDKFR